MPAFRQAAASLTELGSVAAPTPLSPTGLLGRGLGAEGRQFAAEGLDQVGDQTPLISPVAMAAFASKGSSSRDFDGAAPSNTTSRKLIFSI